MKPTEEQLLAIDHTHKRSAIVSAAAGSGKTTLLVERIIRLISDPSCNVSADGLVVVTFTRNAAASLRLKLNRKLSEVIKQTERSDPETAAFLSDQQIKLRQAAIGTINSFCLSVLRENAQLFGLPLSFSIADSGRLFAMQEQAMRGVMAEFYGEFPREEREQLFYTFSFENDAALQAMIFALADKLSSYPDPVKRMDRYLSAYDDIDSLGRTFVGVFIDYYTTCQTRLSAYTDAMEEIFTRYSAFADTATGFESITDEIYEKIQEIHDSIAANLHTFKNILREFNTALAELKNDPTVAGLDAFSKKSLLWINTFEISKKYSRAADDISTDIKNEYKHFMKLCNDILEQIRSMPIDLEAEKQSLPLQRSVTDTLLKLVKRYRELYGEIKESHGALDFSDCEQRLYDLLQTNAEFREQLSARYSCIFIDEFQDSNDLQDGIFTLISNGRDNLFYVGDVKQSIYGFRGGNPTIMANKMKSGEFAEFPLSMNFRSRSPVIDFANAVFSYLMTERYGDVDYTKQALRCGAESFLPPVPEDVDSGTEVHILNLGRNTDESEEDEELGDLRQARFVANRIRELVDSGYPVTEGDTMRPCTYSDITVLIRKNKMMERYRFALSEAGIPAIVPKGKDLLSSEEVTLVLNLLRAIDDPVRDREMLAVMMSPVYGFTAEEMAQIKLGVLGLPLDRLSDEDISDLAAYGYNHSLYQRANYCNKPLNTLKNTEFSSDVDRKRAECEERLAKTGVEREVSPKLALFLSQLSEFRKSMNNMGLESLIRKIYDDTDLYGIVSAMSEGTQGLANIRLLLKYAADYEESEGRTLSDFIRYLGRAADQRNNIEEATAPDDYSNAVRLMTFHGSKGLEMPICIVAELNARVSNQDSHGTALFHPDLGVAMSLVDRRERFRADTLAHRAVSIANTTKVYGEELRTLYVALTRAQEKLIITGSESAEPALLEMRNKQADTALMGGSPFRWTLSSLMRNCTGKSTHNITIMNEPDIEQDGQRRQVGKIYIHETVEQLIHQTEDSTEEVELTAEQTEVAEYISRLMAQEYPYQEDTKRQAKYSVTGLAHQTDSNDEKKSDHQHINPLPPINTDDNVKGSEIGNIYHHIMEFFDLDRIAHATEEQYEDIVINEIFRMRRSGLLDKREDFILETVFSVRKSVYKNITAFFRSDFGRRMLASPRVEREFRIYRHINARELGLDHDSTVILDGRIDLFFVENGEIILVDYKSDTPQNLNDEMAAYSRQIAAYKKVLPLITGLNVSKMYIWSFSAGKEIELK